MAVSYREIPSWRAANVSTWSNIDVSRAANIGFNCSAAAGATDIDVSGLTASGTFSQYALYINAGTARVRGLTIRDVGVIFAVTNDGPAQLEVADLRLTTATNATAVHSTAAGARTVVRDALLAVGAGGDCILADAGVISLDNVTVTAGNVGAHANGGVIRLGDRCDFDACSTSTLLSSGQFNRGQVVGSAVGTVAVPWPDLKKTDRVMLVVSGSATAVATPGVALNSGVGFTIGVDASASTWNYVVR